MRTLSRDLAADERQDAENKRKAPRTAALLEDCIKALNIIDFHPTALKGFLEACVIALGDDLDHGREIPEDQAQAVRDRIQEG